MHNEVIQILILLNKLNNKEDIKKVDINLIKNIYYNSLFNLNDNYIH